MVHQYKLNGYNIVLDTCSGGIHVVDDVAYDMIELYPKKSSEEIITDMMEKYGDREDVNEEELKIWLQQRNYIQKIPLSQWQALLKSVPEMW